MAKRSAVRSYTKRTTRSTAPSRTSSTVSRAGGSGTGYLSGTSRARGSGRTVTAAQKATAAAESRARAAQTAAIRAAATKAKQEKDAADVIRLRALKESEAFKAKYAVSGEAEAAARRHAEEEAEGKPWYYYLSDEYLRSLIGLEGKPEDAPKTPDETTKTRAECAKGLYYDSSWFLPCASGYIEYSIKGHNKCICSVRIHEAKAQLDALYPTTTGNGEGFFGGAGLGKIGDIMPIIVGGAIIVALIGLLKK